MVSTGIYSFTEKSKIYEILYIRKVNCLKEDVFYITLKFIRNVCDQDNFFSSQLRKHIGL